MTNTQSLGTIEATNPVLAVAPLKEETEMLRATDKITALYCRLSVEDLKEDKKGGKEDESNSIQNQKMILLQYAKEHRFPNPTFFVDDGYSGTNFDRPGFQAMLAEIEAGRVAVCCTKDDCVIIEPTQKDLENQGSVAGSVCFLTRNKEIFNFIT